MTIQVQFVHRNYDVFAGLDVNKKSMAVIFSEGDSCSFQGLRVVFRRT